MKPTANRYNRFIALPSLRRDRFERMSTRLTENSYWDRAAPAVFGLFIAALIVLLVLSYAGVPII
jgi:hypothetical protein